MIRYSGGFINPEHITQVCTRGDHVHVHLATKVDHVVIAGEEAANLVEKLTDRCCDIRVKDPEPCPEPEPASAIEE